MNKVLIRQFGLREYLDVYRAMTEYTDRRNEASADEIWCLEHEPVFTLGLAGKTEHILDAGDIPVHKVDRGGQVTYHGPGQLVVYLLFDLKRQGISIKRFVNLLEQSVIQFLAAFGLEALRRQGAPGVYVDDKKIAALGVRVRKGCCYHGVSLNVCMDLSPYQRINPCGFPGLEITQLTDWGIRLSTNEAVEKFLPCLLNQFIYNEVEMLDERVVSFTTIAACPPFRRMPESSQKIIPCL